MFDNLGTELTKAIALYKNRKQLFQTNGNKAAGFQIRDVVRSVLFAKAESVGYIPIPSFHFYHWTFDLVCMKGTEIKSVFVIRETDKEDYRQLLLFPSSIDRVLIPFSKKAIPEGVPEIKVIKVINRKTAPIQTGIPARDIIKHYNSAFRKAYGIEPFESNAQLLAPATRMSNFWPVQGQGMPFNEYCIFVMQLIKAKSQDGETNLIRLRDLLNKEYVAKFKLDHEKRHYDGSWTKRGWDSLGAR